jgi:hypothetical protein
MSASIGELAKALAAAQAELKPAAKNATNPMLRNKYADLASCMEACSAILPKHGLAISQIVVPAEPGCVSVDTLLMHSSGEWIKGRCTLPSVGNKGVNAAQAAGSAITYARRYGLSAIIGLATDDDDGCAAGPTREQKRQEREQHKAVQEQAKAANPSPLSEAQRKLMFARLAELGCKKQEEYLAEVSAILGRNIQTSNEITQDDFQTIMKATEPPAPVDDYADVPDLPQFGAYGEAVNA